MSKIGTGYQPGFLSAPQWKDENFDPLAARIKGNNDLPGTVNVPGTDLFMAKFANGAFAEVPVSGKEVNHDWVPGTNLSVHAHILKAAAGAGNVELAFEYRVVSEAVTPVYGTLTKVVAVPATAWTVEQIVILGEIDMSTFTNIGAQVTFRFFRNSGAAADTYADDIVLTTFGWHYQVNTNGSRLIGAK